MTDINFVSLPGVLTCAVGGVIRAFAWSFNRRGLSGGVSQTHREFGRYVLHAVDAAAAVPCLPYERRAGKKS